MCFERMPNLHPLSMQGATRQTVADEPLYSFAWNCTCTRVE